MSHSLYEVLGELPGESRVYCAHEYTESNLRFALSVDGGNTELVQYQREVLKKRAQSLPTVPSLLADERAVNPFLRCDTEAIRAATRCTASRPRHEVFGILRAMKDNF